MLLRLKYLVFFSLALGFYYFGCTSGEYEIEEHKIDYVEKTLKFDTVYKVVQIDTSGKNPYKDTTTIKPNFTYTYIVQIGAFLVKSNCERFMERARQVLGEDVFFEETSLMCKVRVGKYSDKATALNILNVCKSKGYDDAFIVTVKK